MLAGALTASYLNLLKSRAYEQWADKKEKNLPEVVEGKDNVRDGEAGTKIPGALQVVLCLQLQPELLCPAECSQPRGSLLERCRRPWLPQA